MTSIGRCIAYVLCGVAAAATLAERVASQSGMPARAPVACEKLASAAGPETRVTAAVRVAGGAFTAPGQPSEPFNPTFSKMPAFCRIAATISPVAGSEIKMEVWMPAEGWNGKFVGIGNGGFSGAIWYPAMSDPLQRGTQSRALTGATTAEGQTRVSPSGIRRNWPTTPGARYTR